ncbi:MAG: DUF1592 domain-containing protein [Oligoflexus sp.]|nr:DUF1592 domain-containing protein [Oligoflexus sp.]
MKIAPTLVTLALLVTACKDRPARLMSFKNASDARDLGSKQGQGPGFPVTPIEKMTMQRLNRFEYNNTVQDLLDMPLRPADAFPSDPVTHGFDNIAENLTLTPALTSLLNQTAESIAKSAVKEQARTLIDLNPVNIAGGSPGIPLGIIWSLMGELPVKFKLDFDEILKIEVLAGGKAIDAPTPTMTFKVDGKDVKSFEVKAGPFNPDSYAIEVNLPKGDHSFTVRIDNFQAANPFNGSGNQLLLSKILIRSKTLVLTTKNQLLRDCAQDAKPDLCKVSLVLSFAEKAWRRPLTLSEKSTVKALWMASLASGAGEEEALRTTLQGIMLSSKFLFRTLVPRPGETAPIAYIDDYSLANRLSFFLWGSMPDDELFEAAADGSLRSEEGLKAEIKRMLKDPKSIRLVKGFASQWLGTRSLEQVERDATLFPSFGGPLKNSMTNETELLFADFLHNGRPLDDLLKPGFAFLDDRLAAHYGLPLPKSETPLRVILNSNQRGGLLTQASWLSFASLTTDTMPTKRGSWIMENLLCMPVPVPPAVPPLPLPAPGEAKIQSVRDRMLTHATDPSCKSCHGIIDPIGFGLEAYDAVGALRSLDSAGKPVDTKGTLPGGEAFTDAEGLVNVIYESPHFRKCLTKKLYSYALGRATTALDKGYLKNIEIKLAQDQGSLEQLIELIVLGPTFRKANFSEEP